MQKFCKDAMCQFHLLHGHIQTSSFTIMCQVV